MDSRYDTSPVNKLDIMTWFLWALRNFQRFTFHLRYKTEIYSNKLKCTFDACGALSVDLDGTLRNWLNWRLPILRTRGRRSRFFLEDDSLAWLLRECFFQRNLLTSVNWPSRSLIISFTLTSSSKSTSVSPSLRYFVYQLMSVIFPEVGYYSVYREDHSLSVL